MIDFGLVYVAESPIYSQDGVYYYPSDPKIPGTDFRVGMNPDKKFKRYKGLGSLEPITTLLIPASTIANVQGGCLP